MSYEKLIQRDVPYAYYNLDSAGASRPPLVWEGAGASLITNQTVTYDLPVFNNRKQSFVQEVWFRPLDYQAINILGHSEGDGLKWNDGNISYELWIGNQKIILHYYAKILQTFHVVVYYNKTSVSLYVNGEIKDSHTFVDNEITLDYYSFSASPTLTTKGNNIAFIIDAVAFYTDMDPYLPIRHYNWAQPKTYIIRNAGMQSAETFEFYTDNFQPEIVQLDLTNATLNNTSVSKNLLTQIINEDGSISAGSWFGFISTRYQNNIIEYKSTEKINVSYSLDGTNFLTTTNYVDTENQDYFILKLELTNVLTEVSNVNVVQYDDKTLSTYGGLRTTSVANTPILTDYFYPTIAFDQGVQDALTITGDESANAVEFWIKAGTETSITTLSGTKTINNGAGWFSNDWNHVVVTGSVPTSFTIGKVGSKVSIINVYTTSPDVNSLYLSYFGRNKYEVSDTSVTTITDDFKQYGYTWSIIAG